MSDDIKDRLSAELNRWKTYGEERHKFALRTLLESYKKDEEIARLSVELELAKERAQTAVNRCEEIAKERPISEEMYNKVCAELDAAREYCKRFTEVISRF